VDSNKGCDSFESLPIEEAWCMTEVPHGNVIVICHLLYAPFAGILTQLLKLRICHGG
jgi:hypothetical protein